MAELDVEKLKRKIGGAAAAGTQALLSVAEWQYLAAALGDRDRLRAVAQKVCEALDLPAIPGDTSEWIRAPSADVLALETALEHRDG